MNINIENVLTIFQITRISATVYDNKMMADVAIISSKQYTFYHTTSILFASKERKQNSSDTDLI